ncbi:glycosyltransferase [Lacinutrix undariae]
MKPRYTVILHTPQELNHSSYVQTGLFELEQAGFVSVKVKVDIRKRLGRINIHKQKVSITEQANPKVSYYELVDKVTGKVTSFACDLYDHDNAFSEYAFIHCDYVFKRNYEDKMVQLLPIENQEKIYKFGLSFGVRSPYHKSKNKFKCGLFLSQLLLHLKYDRNIFKRLQKTYAFQKKHWNFIETTRLLSRFENFEIPDKKSVFFQTRCFGHENDPDVKDIHQQRYHIIKLLKREFPNVFQGGFIASPIANTCYKDALSNVPSEPELYLNALKQAKIVIYTRGLAKSPAWKMAEYLSQAKVIIAEKLTTDLPVTLVHGQELLYFETDEQLIHNIKRVMGDDELASRLSKNARTYFETHVHPTENIKRILDFMIANNHQTH